MSVVSGVGLALPPRASYRQAPKGIRSRNYSLAAWFALVGMVLPGAEVQVFVADTKFTAGRIGVMLLFFPAIFMLCRKGRFFLLSDFFALATATWCIAAALYAGGSSSLSSASAVSIEFLCGYIAARAFFYGSAAISTFIQVLKILTVISIILAMADSITGRWVSHEAAGIIFHTSALGPVFRGSMIRATSTFDHPILLGTFCSVVAAILLYLETNAIKRFFYVAFCVLGCILSQSSAALMSLAIVLACYTYDRSMKQYSWRWTAFWLAIFSFVTVVFLVTAHPIGWMISHLTLDPQTGYFRILIWDAAMDKITQAPLFGFAFNMLNHEILDTTVDSVWLVNALRFGVPMIVFLFLTNAAAFWPTSGRLAKRRSDLVDSAFTMTLIMLMFIGLTVHYWNFVWIFWSLCIGLRASRREEQFASARAPIRRA